MKYLVPVDISDFSSNALKYATKMCKANDELIIYHVYNQPVYPSETGGGYMPSVDTEDIREQVGILVDVTNPPKNGPSISIELGTGETVHSIVRKAHSEDFDAIIMGVRDKHGFMEKIFGTIATGVVKLAQIPVYLIPLDHTYVRPKHVLVAADEHFKSPQLIDQILEWNKKNKASLTFFYVNEGDQDSESLKEDLLEELIVERNPGFSISYAEERNDNVCEAILNKSTEENSDLIILAAESSSWIANVFINSVSKEMILKANRPMLFLHAESIARKPLSRTLTEITF